MKKYLNILIFTLLLLNSGCKKYLNVAPDNIGTIDYAFRMRTEAEKYLFTCYNNLPSFGNTDADPGFLGGDEFAVQYPSSIYFGVGLYRIARGEQSVSNPQANYWDSGNGGKPYFQAIRECNLFLENVGKVPDLSDAEEARWTAEVKLLKAYYHFYLMRMYGPVPIIRVNLPISAPIEAVRVSRAPIDSVTNYIVGLIDESIPSLPAQIMNTTSELGRLTRPIALAIKAQVLMTVASPLFNGNPSYANFRNKDGLALFPTAYSQEKWKKAADACRLAIESAESTGAKLHYYVPLSNETASDSTKITLNVRTAITEKWNSEIIWGGTNAMVSGTQALAQARITSGDEGSIPTPPANNESIRSILSPPIHIAEMFYSNNGVPIEEDKNYDYSNRLTKIRTVTDAYRFYLKKDYETVQLNFDREPRFYADLGFDGGIWYGQGLFNDTKTWFIKAKAGQFGARLGASLYSVTGYWAKKLVNYRNDFGSNSTGYNVTAYPFPIIRLSELYLLYAEALNEQNGPAESYKWIDLVRKRAGLKGVQESWAASAKNPSKPNSKEGFREIVQREQMIELVFEGKRFWSLRRWKKAEQYLNIPIRGWDLDQSEAIDYYRVKSLFTPTFISRDYLWPIAEGTIVSNPNLVQNPGW